MQRIFEDNEDRLTCLDHLGRQITVPLSIPT